MAGAAARSMAVAMAARRMAISESLARVPPNLIGATLLALDCHHVQPFQLLAAGDDADHHIWPSGEDEAALCKASVGAGLGFRVGLAYFWSVAAATVVLLFVLDL